MGDLSPRHRHMQDLSIKLGPNPAHIGIPPKRDPPLEMRWGRVRGHVGRVEAKRDRVGVPPVRGDDEQTTAAGGDGYGGMVEMRHADGRGRRQRGTRVSKQRTHRQTSMYWSGLTSTLTLGLSSPRGSFAGRNG